MKIKKLDFLNHTPSGAKSVIRPPFKKFTKGVAFFPFQMGDHVMVGEGSIVNAASIGSYVNIGELAASLSLKPATQTKMFAVL